MEEKISEMILNKQNLSQIRQNLLEENPVDIAALFEELEGDNLVRVFRLLPKELAAEVFAYMETDMQQSIVEAITDRELSGIVDELFLDDTVDFIDEMPASVVKRVLKNADPNKRNLINQWTIKNASAFKVNELKSLSKDLNTLWC